MTSFSEGFILGLWRSRNRPNDTPEQRAQLRKTLRDCVQYERAKRQRLQ